MDVSFKTSSRLLPLYKIRILLCVLPNVQTPFSGGERPNESQGHSAKGGPNSTELKREVPNRVYEGINPKVQNTVRSNNSRGLSQEKWNELFYG